MAWRTSICDGPAKLAAITGPRLAAHRGRRHAACRSYARPVAALAAQRLDPGSPIEFAVGLERNQLLLALHKKLEVWDAVSGRPMLRPQLALPPPPRTVGAAYGHLWATRPGSDEVFVYRLSDGRPFRHHVGAAVQDVVCHPASPVIVLVTPRGLVRLHCFAHSLMLVDGAPWTPGTPLALLVNGDDVALLGMREGSPESNSPWRVALAGTGAPVVAAEPDTEPREQAPLVTAADRLRAMRSAQDAPAPGASRPEARADGRSEPRIAMTRGWRDPLASYGAELVRGVDGELPVVAVDTELGELAHRLALPASARRALTALYSLYLVGEPAIRDLPARPRARRLDRAARPGRPRPLALIDRTGGKVALRRAVTELLDGAPACAIRHRRRRRDHTARRCVPRLARRPRRHRDRDRARDRARPDRRRRRRPRRGPARGAPAWRDRGLVRAAGRAAAAVAARRRAGARALRHAVGVGRRRREPRAS